MSLWNTILSHIEKKVSPQNYEVWFKPTRLLEEDSVEKGLVVRVPNSHYRYWLRAKYGELIDSVLADLNLNGFRVSFVVSSIGPAGDSLGVETKDSLSAQSEQPNLNRKFTFDNFVVGSCNQLAHAASIAVGEQPSRAYNPLFIFGGVGLGKTHLMHAIGHSIKARQPSLRLKYMPSEAFTNDLIISLQRHQTLQFRETYRNIDVLLMDDIQFLAGKERTQEEFFHTFNALYDSQRQIVISSDRPPREIPTLQERLHNRFEWGLIADIQPPDLETKLAILGKKAEIEGVALPENVSLFIANNIRSTVRELEGSLIRLIAYSSLTGERIDLPLAEKVLRNIIDKRSRITTIESIQKLVAEHYSLTVNEIKNKDNSRRVAEPRQVAMFLCKKLTNSSLPQIGRAFGGKHHTTVLHSVRKVRALQEQDPRFEATLNRLIDTLQ